MLQHGSELAGNNFGFSEAGVEFTVLIFILIPINFLIEIRYLPCM
jgi:hypothetical protein